MYKNIDLKRAFLLLVSGVVIVIALAYGVDPQWFAREFLGLPNIGVSLAHILRAVMGLYLALAAFWIACALTGKHKNVALLTFMVFAAGLVLGRCLSFAIDGLPAPLLIVYAGLEAAVLPLAWWVWRLGE